MVDHFCIFRLALRFVDQWDVKECAAVSCVALANLGYFMPAWVTMWKIRLVIVVGFIRVFGKFIYVGLQLTTDHSREETSFLIHQSEAKILRCIKFCSNCCTPKSVWGYSEWPSWYWRSGLHNIIKNSTLPFLFSNKVPAGKEASRAWFINKSAPT